ncbi:RNI-like protein, partial [Saccharata proteae CBS 121410]
SRSSSRSSRGSLSDNDSLSLHSNDSQSSIAPSIPEPASQETCELSPVHRLPAELIISVFAKLSSPADVRNCMLVSKDWARNAVGLLWHRPQTHKWPSIQIVAQSLRKADSYFAYDTLVKRLNMSALGNEISDGTLQPFSGCKRIERLTLTNCNKLTDLSMVPMLQGNRSLLALDVTSLESITDLTMTAVSNNCYKLQGLNISNCRKISDEALESVARSCKNLKRLKFNGCSQLTEKSIIVIANNCRYILEIDLHDCRNIEDAAITSLVAEGRYLRELRLAHCSRITDHAFLNLPHGIIHDALRILDLTDCGELNDDGVQKIISTAPRLRNLVLAKCRKITDRAVYAITKLGKNLHYIHLGHCARITDAGVLQLVKQCSRIRYIDLACCNNLSDNSIKQLATLPKLKRIGLVKCGQITDQSIVALAKPKQVGPNGQVAPSSLERVHLSYCTLLTLNGIHALLNNCPRLTHLSLTGVISFLREDLLVFCREAPPEFNEHQRDVFCVFSGSGVSRLRDHLNEEQLGQLYEPDGTMYDDGDDGN